MAKSQTAASLIGHQQASSCSRCTPSALWEEEHQKVYLLYSETGSQSLASGKQNWGIALRRSSASRICLVGLSSCRGAKIEVQSVIVRASSTAPLSSVERVNNELWRAKAHQLVPYWCFEKRGTTPGQSYRCKYNRNRHCFFVVVVFFLVFF